MTNFPLIPYLHSDKIENHSQDTNYKLNDKYKIHRPSYNHFTSSY